MTSEQEARGTVGGPVSPPPHWLERGKPSYQASLIVDPPDGRMPPQTPEAAERMIAQRDARAGRGPADSYEDRSLYDQCITRGVLGSILPVIYNNGNQIIQAPGLVVLRNEMIHETRFFYLDGRPHVSSKIRSYMGDSRARWDGDTLVVETTNMFDRNGVGGNGGGQAFSDALKITERFTRVDADIDHVSGRRSTIRRPTRGRSRSNSRGGATKLRDVRVRLPRGQPLALQHPQRRARRRCGGCESGRIASLRIAGQAVPRHRRPPRLEPCTITPSPLPLRADGSQ